MQHGKLAHCINLAQSVVWSGMVCFTDKGRWTGMAAWYLVRSHLAQDVGWWLDGVHIHYTATGISLWAQWAGRNPVCIARMVSHTLGMSQTPNPPNMGKVDRGGACGKFRVRLPCPFFVFILIRKGVAWQGPAMGGAFHSANSVWQSCNIVFLFLIFLSSILLWGCGGVRAGKDQLCSLRAPEQNENADLWFKIMKSFKTVTAEQNQAKEPSVFRALCNCTGCTPLKLPWVQGDQGVGWGSGVEREMGFHWSNRHQTVTLNQSPKWQEFFSSCTECEKWCKRYCSLVPREFQAIIFRFYGSQEQTWFCKGGGAKTARVTCCRSRCWLVADGANSQASNFHSLSSPRWS